MFPIPNAEICSIIVFSRWHPVLPRPHTADLDNSPDLVDPILEAACRVHLLLSIPSCFLLLRPCVPDVPGGVSCVPTSLHSYLTPIFFPLFVYISCGGSLYRRYGPWILHILVQRSQYRPCSRQHPVQRPRCKPSFPPLPQRFRPGESMQSCAENCLNSIKKHFHYSRYELSVH